MWQDVIGGRWERGANIRHSRRWSCLSLPVLMGNHDISPATAVDCYDDESCTQTAHIGRTAESRQAVFKGAGTVQLSVRDKQTSQMLKKVLLLPAVNHPSLAGSPEYVDMQLFLRSLTVDEDRYCLLLLQPFTSTKRPLLSEVLTRPITSPGKVCF